MLVQLWERVASEFRSTTPSSGQQLHFLLFCEYPCTYFPPECKILNACVDNYDSVLPVMKAILEIKEQGGLL